MIIIPTLLYAKGMNAAPLLTPALSEIAHAPMAFDFATFVTSTIAGLAQICFRFEAASGICILLALLVSSRIDTAVAIVCTAASTAMAIAIGLPEENIILGFYGFNAALTGIGLFGRAFRMSVASAMFTLLMAAGSVLLAAALSAIFLPLGIPVAALPFGLIVITCIIAKDNLGNLTPVSFRLWGVPETIEKALKAQDAEKANEQ
jgi:urea transporter